MIFYRSMAIIIAKEDPKIEAGAHFIDAAPPVNDAGSGPLVVLLG